MTPSSKVVHQNKLQTSNQPFCCEMISNFVSNRLINNCRLLNYTRFFCANNVEKRAPYPPFTEETARQKVQAAEDAWNTKDAKKVSMAYTINSKWRNRDTFIEGREAIQAFLIGKWEKELDYKLKKHYFCHNDNQIAVTFQYEYKNRDNGKYYRAYGNEHWTFDENGLMQTRNASINDVEINESELQIGVDGKNIGHFKTGVEK